MPRQFPALIPANDIPDQTARDYQTILQEGWSLLTGTSPSSVLSPFALNLENIQAMFGQRATVEETSSAVERLDRRMELWSVLCAVESLYLSATASADQSSQLAKTLDTLLPLTDQFDEALEKNNQHRHPQFQQQWTTRWKPELSPEALEPPPWWDLSSAE